MGRRNQSIVKDAIIVASRLPWWSNILLAITSYFVLNYFVTIQNQPVDGIENIGQFAGKQIFVIFSLVGKFIVPFIFQGTSSMES
ncbi:MAG TPA: hypothetical protein DCO75_08970 [Fibrobacteres bacterium]|jgi:restriction system protein|nr:hypothetical protein [Fibrobacterota bacterium]